MGVDPFRQPGDQLPELCRAERLHDPLPIDLPGGDAQRDVGREAAVGDEKVLRDVPDAVLPCPAVGRRKWRAVDGDFTPARLVQPQQQVEERRFPGARGSADTDALALADRQRKAVKKLAPAVREAEPKVAHGDLMPERQLFGGAGGIGGGVPGIAGIAGIAGGNGCGGCAARAGGVPAVRVCRRRGAVRCGVAQDADRVAVVFDGRPAGHDVAHRGHQAQCGHGEYAEQHLRPPVAVAEAQCHEQGHAHGQPDLGEGLGQQPDRRFAQARADHLIHRPVELAEHHREGIVDLDVGIAAEGLGHEPRLFALRLVFQFPVAVDAVAHQSVIEPDRGQEDRQGEQCREGRVPHQRPEQQHEQHRLGGDGGGGFAAKARQTTLTLRASTAEFDALTNGSPRSW